MGSLTLDWIQLAAVVGALQGILLAGVLVTQRSNRTANRLLAALMATFTIYLASGIYYEGGFIRVYPHLFGISYQTPWVFGPLVYLYAVAASDRSWRFGRRELLHFLPVAVSVAVSAPYYAMSGAEKIAMFERLAADDVPARLMLLDPLKYVSGIAYSVATALYLRRHRRRVEDSYSNPKRFNLRWLLWLAVAAAAIWLLATVLGVTPMGDSLRDEPVTLAIAVLVYAIGYMGLRQPEVFRYETAEFPVVTNGGSVAAAPLPPAPVSTEDATPRYERSGLGDAEAEGLERSLRMTMDSAHPWKDSELTLADLATQIGTTPHKLSEVLNSCIGQTFHDFVNGYRVREVQRRIAEGETARRTMFALALDAGFASKSTFNQAFRKHTNQTPSAFRESLGGDAR